MVILEVLTFTIDGKKNELKYFKMNGTNEPWFLLDDVFNIVKYEKNEYKNKEKFIKFSSKNKGFGSFKDTTNWIDEEGELVVDESTSEKSTYFITWSNIFNLLKSGSIEGYVNQSKINQYINLYKLKRLEEFIVNVFLNDLKRSRKGLKLEAFNKKIDKIKKDIDEILKLKKEIDEMEGI